MSNEVKNAGVELVKQELARRNFWRFCLFYDHEFFTDRAFFKDIAQSFQDIEQGSIKSLSVSLPPRAGKSYLTSLFCAWTLGRNPDQSVMRNTCTATLYLKFSYDVRAILKSDRFMKVFPEVRLSDDKANLQGWNTNKSKQVGYFGAGVGGTIIGFGATKVGITDDLYRGIEDALSDTVNDRIHQWKQSTHDSRFESGCARIDIGTRWSLNDVIGRNYEQKIYDRSISIPALNEAGESFCKSVMTTDEFIDKRKHTAKEIWMAEYMQEPVDVKGRLFNDLKYIEPDAFKELTKQHLIEGCVAYIDVADMGADYTALSICAIVNNEFYVVDYFMSKANTDVTIPLCASKLDQWNVSYCRVESNSMGAMFGRHLQKQTKARVLQVHNTTNKQTRIIMQSAFIQNRFNFVKRNDESCELFMTNVASYSKEGKNKNDDAPDCLAGLGLFVQSMFRNLV
jgi:predicted phage terminase large subunit-like protein